MGGDCTKLYQPLTWRPERGICDNITWVSNIKYTGHYYTCYWTMAQEAFPLHYLVWNNQYQELDRELQSNQVMLGLDVGDGLCIPRCGHTCQLLLEVAGDVFIAQLAWSCTCVFSHVCLRVRACVHVCLQQQDLERLDPRGRTPLELAICLGHLESTRVLLRHNADPTHCNAQNWTGMSISPEEFCCHFSDCCKVTSV